MIYVCVLFPGLFLHCCSWQKPFTSPSHFWQYVCRQRWMDFEVSAPMHFKQDLTHFAILPRGRKNSWKKKKSFSLHPDRVHSDHLLFHAQICGSAASIFTSIRNLSGSAVCAFSKDGGIQVQLWPRAGNCLMYRSLQALCRFRRLHLCLTDCEQSWLFRKVVCMEGDWCFTEVIHCYQSTIMVTGT